MTETILITGAGGEIGHGLISFLLHENDSPLNSSKSNSKIQILATDLAEQSPDSSFSDSRVIWQKLDVTDRSKVLALADDFNITAVYHLAALLSSAAAKNPSAAHRVNVDGSINLLDLAEASTHKLEREVNFFFPSSIAVYGRPLSEIDATSHAIGEKEWLWPHTFYGVHKLFIEHSGRLRSELNSKLDFRSIRFPGILSADTVPTGGTSDYGPEMLHAAAKGEEYACFVDASRKLPFMVMPDAVRAMVELSSADRACLTQCVYNVAAFAPSASELKALTCEYFPSASINFKPDQIRDDIVAKWPDDIDDSSARQDWGWKERYNLGEAFADYLVPGVQRLYKQHDVA